MSTRHLPQTYTVTCSPSLMTENELRRLTSLACAKQRNAETDSEYAAWSVRAEELLTELERREESRRS